MANETNGRMWEIVKEIDEYIGGNDVTDWELNFISDMMELRRQVRGYTVKQREHILRIWEKYCL